MMKTASTSGMTSLIITKEMCFLLTSTRSMLIMPRTLRTRHKFTVRTLLSTCGVYLRRERLTSFTLIPMISRSHQILFLHNFTQGERTSVCMKNLKKGTIIVDDHLNTLCLIRHRQSRTGWYAQWLVEDLLPRLTELLHDGYQIVWT